MASVLEVNEKRINPIHFFNAKGVSIMNAEWQSDRIDALEKENADLQAKVKRLQERLRRST